MVTREEIYNGLRERLQRYEGRLNTRRRRADMVAEVRAYLASVMGPGKVPGIHVLISRRDACCVLVVDDLRLEEMRKAHAYIDWIFPEELPGR